MTAPAGTATAKDRKYLAWAVSGASIFSTCGKASYMAIVVDRYGIVVGTGYNGPPPGMTHCTDGGCPRAREQTAQGGSYANCVAVHAEQGAILRATYGSLTDGTLYVNGMPCWECAKSILSTKLARVVFLSGREPVDKASVLDFLGQGGIEVVEVDANDLA